MTWIVYVLFYIKIHVSIFLFFYLCSNKTLWGSLKEPDIVNTNEFEDLFSKATIKEKKKPLLDTYEKKTKAKKVGSFPQLLCSFFHLILWCPQTFMAFQKHS